MSAAGYLLLALFAVMVGAAILWPVMADRQRSRSAFTEEFGQMSQVARFRAERDAIMDAVRELDFDFQTGKLTETDYRVQREMLMQRGIEVTKQLETAQSEAIEAAVKSLGSVKH